MAKFFDKWYKEQVNIKVVKNKNIAGELLLQEDVYLNIFNSLSLHLYIFKA